MVWPALAAGAAIGVASGAGQYFSARASAQRQMNFQKKILQNQYKWTMRDMREAGLNPILAYQQGGPGGAMGASYPGADIAGAAAEGVNTAMTAQRMSAEKKVLESQEKVNLSQDLVNYETAQEKMAHGHLMTKERMNVEKIGKVLDSEVASAKALEKYLKTDFGQKGEMIKRFREQLFGGRNTPSLGGRRR